MRNYLCLETQSYRYTWLEIKCKLAVIFFKENNVGKSKLKLSVQKNTTCTCAFLIISAHLNLNMKYIQVEKVLKIRMQF